MNVFGLEVNVKPESTDCEDLYCGTVIPICFAGISPSHTESNNVWSHRFKSWYQRHWSSLSLSSKHPNAHLHFAGTQLLPWWLQCNKCGRWRALPASRQVGNSSTTWHPNSFECSSLSSKSTSSSSACETIPVDDRVSILLQRPHDFLASIRLHVLLLQGVYKLPIYHSPFLSSKAQHLLDQYGFSTDRVPGLDDNNVWSKEMMVNINQFKPFSNNTHIHPNDIGVWERKAFPEMTRIFPTLYLAIRNVVLALWYADPKLLVTSKRVASCLFIRGLIRILLIEHWIPRIIEELTFRSVINVGLCTNNLPNQIDSTNATKLHLIGSRDDLETGVCLRQLINSCSDRSQLSVKFDQFPRHSPSPISPRPTCTNLLGTFTVRLGDKNEQKSVDTQFPTISLESCEGLEKSLSIDLPLHAWLSNLVHIDHKHPLAIMAHQTQLSLRPMPECRLLYCCKYNDKVDGDISSTGQQQPALSSVPIQLSDRIEFHVEAVLDLASQLVNSSDLSIASASIQDNWDRVDAEMRLKVTDIDQSELHRALIEFHLASVERSLTDSLLINTITSLSHTSSSRLDQLSTRHYLDQLDCASTSGDNLPANASSHLLASTSDDPKCTASRLLLSALFAQSESGESQMTSLSVVHKSPDVKSADITDVDPTKTNLDGSGSGGEQESYRLSINHVDRQMQQFSQEVDWVVINLPLDQLRFAFTDDDDDNDKSPDPPPPSLSYLTLNLPTTFKSLICQPSSAEPCQTLAPVNGQRLISVILIYSRAWWRRYLKRLAPNSPTGEQREEEQQEETRMQIDDGEEKQEVDGVEEGCEVFAFLPNDRQSRGFCHRFRDLSSSSTNHQSSCNQPGVLQTELFATAADQWWSDSDSNLASVCNTHLVSSFGLNDVVDDSINLIGSYVGRLDSASRSPILVGDSAVTQSTHQLIQLMTTGDANSDSSPHRYCRPTSSAFDQLASRLGIIIPSLGDVNEESTNGSSDDHKTNSEVPALNNCSDFLSSAVQRGLDLAQLTLRRMTSSSQRHFLSQSPSLDAEDDMNQDSPNEQRPSEPSPNDSVTNGSSRSSITVSSSQQMSQREIRRLKRMQQIVANDNAAAAAMSQSGSSDDSE